MDFIQTVIIGFALSGPIAILIGIGRTIMCLDRSIRAKHTKYAIFSVLNILILLTFLAAIVVVWFAYGVAHTGKDATTDLVVLASTVTPAYLVVLAIWLVSRRLEKRFGRNAL